MVFVHVRQKNFFDRANVFVLEVGDDDAPAHVEHFFADAARVEEQTFSVRRDDNRAIALPHVDETYFNVARLKNVERQQKNYRQQNYRATQNQRGVIKKSRGQSERRHLHRAERQVRKNSVELCARPED